MFRKMKSIVRTVIAFYIIHCILLSELVTSKSLSDKENLTTDDPCSDNPCKNKGICTVAGTGYKCNCKPPYFGDKCEKDPCTANPCENGGLCNVTSTGYKCNCKQPYSGDKCEKVADPCKPNPCQNGGTCNTVGNNFNCQCSENFGGDKCDIKCKCKNGNCKRESSGKIACDCFPEFGIYHENECRACGCGKKANCTFDVGIFSTDKYCLCPNGMKLKNEICKEVFYTLETTEEEKMTVTSKVFYTLETTEEERMTVTSRTEPYSTEHSKSTGWSESTEITRTESPYTTEYSESTDWSESTLITRTEPYSTEHSKSTDWSESTEITRTESPYTTEYSESTDWSESTLITKTVSPYTTDISAPTAEICDCGQHSIACYLDNAGKKMCLCEIGFSQLFDMCIDCYCGEKSSGCFFAENKEKKCLCNEGYAQDHESCKETCKYDRECENGGICKMSREGKGFCECRVDYSGDRCEINNVCEHFDDICQRYGAVCVIRDGLPSCECPSDKKDVTGLCESICDPSKCVHGRCEIFGDVFECRCEMGFDGKYCDTKIRPNKRDEIIFILFVVCILFLVIFAIGVLCITLYIRLKKNAVDSDLEKLVKGTRTEPCSVQRLQ